MADWRLQGQERYLKGVHLYWTDYKPRSAEWDHDHCEFCARKFAKDRGDFTAGYATIDLYHWVCPDCYKDFKKMFDWPNESEIQ
jgi:hypothetical protein